MNPPRRVVTGLNAEGRSSILFDDASDLVIWRTETAPADNSGLADTGGGRFAFPADGTAFRYFDFPPGYRIDMHASDSVDYVAVIAGEILLITETGETMVRAGDVIVNRGNLHAWRNESGAPCRCLFAIAAARPVGGGASADLDELVGRARRGPGPPED